MSKEFRIPLRYLLPLTLLLAIILVLLLAPRQKQRARELEIERTAAVVEQVRSIGELSSAGFYEELVLTDRDESYLGELKRASGLNRLTGSGDFVTSSVQSRNNKKRLLVQCVADKIMHVIGRKVRERLMCLMLKLML